MQRAESIFGKSWHPCPIEWIPVPKKFRSSECDGACRPEYIYFESALLHPPKCCYSLKVIASGAKQSPTLRGDCFGKQRLAMTSS